MFNPDSCPPSRRSETGSASASTVNDDPRGSAVDGSRGPNRDRGEKEATVAPHAKPKKTRGRVKIEMKFIKNKLRRCTTFSKRKTGIMKKAKELATLTGTQILLLVASETGHVYSNATYKLRPMLESDKGKSLIRTCLGSPDPPPHYDPSADPRISVAGYEEPALSGGQQQLAVAASGSEGQQGHAKDDMQLTFNEGGLPGAAGDVQSGSPTTAPSGAQGSSIQPFPINYMQPVLAGGNFTTQQLANGYAIMPDFYNPWYSSPTRGQQQYRADWQFAYSQTPPHHMQLTHTQAQQDFLTTAPPGSVQNQDDPMGSGPPQQSGSSRNPTELQAANVDAAHYPNMQIYNAGSLV